MSKKTKTNFISASVKKVLSLTLLVTGGVVMSSMVLTLLLQDTASSNNENVQVWGVQSRVQYLTEMTLSWANNNHIKFKYEKDTNSLNLNAAVNLHALILGSSNTGVAGATVIGGHDNKVQGDWQNAAIIGGSNNTTNNTTSSIIAGSKGSSITKAGESAIFSAQGTIVGGENLTDTVFIVWGQNHFTTNASTVFIAGAEGIQTTKSHNVLIGKNIHSDQSNIFVWSNGNTELTPQKGSAFYVNSTSGFGLNTNNPQAALDIANGGLAFNKVYQLSDLADVKEPWVILMVAKDGKQGICAYNETTWVPLSLNAEREWLCVGNTQPARPIHVLRESVAISGAVANGSAVLTNGVTSLPQVWSGGMNNNHGGWINHPWTYKHTGTLNDGEYRCGIGYHMGNPTPDGMKNTNCSSCTPIINQRDWRSNGKNNDCEFSCKAGFKKVGRSCDTCEVWTYSVNGTTANSCASCTNKPANSHYTSNGTSATSCTWACDAGYYNVGWVCKKAVWKPTVTPTCKAYPGKWKDALKITTYSCALQEDPSVAVPEHICAHWSAKPANQTVAFADENCNPPEWETNRTCPQPACNLSRIAGKCGGNVSENVTCTQHKRDRAWNSYETRTQSQQKACTRTCETAACGAANDVATKYQPTALCAAGTASAVGGNPSVWSWTCTQLDGAKNCSANRLPLQAGSCGSSHNIDHDALNAGSANLCNYGTVITFSENTAIYPNRWSWKCRGDNGAHNQDANCIAHKPAPEAGKCAQAANTCTVGTVKDATNIANGKRWSCEGRHGWSTDTTCSLCDNGYIYNSATNRCDPKCGAGYTLHAGICVKWACVTASPSPKLWWIKSASSEMPRGWMSLFSVSAWSLYEWPQWSRWTHSFQWPRWPQWSPAPKWPSETSEGPLEHGRPKGQGPKGQGPKGPERAPFQPPVHVTQQYQWPSWPRKPQQSPTWLNKTARCVDDKWNIRPDDFCVNAGPKPECGSTSATTPPLQQCSVGFTLSNGKCVKWECKKEEKCSCLKSQQRIQISCGELGPGHEGFCYRELPPIPTVTEDTKQQCESKPQCQWRAVTQSICVDNNSNRLSDEACSSIGPKESCSRPLTPPPPSPKPLPTPQKIDGQCNEHETDPFQPGEYMSYTSQPANSTTEWCIAGDYEDMVDDASNYKWKCKGRNWGGEEQCLAKKNPIKRGTNAFLSCGNDPLNQAHFVWWEDSVMNFDSAWDPTRLYLKFRTNLVTKELLNEKWDTERSHCNLIIKWIFSYEDILKYGKGIQKLFQTNSETDVRTSISNYDLKRGSAMLYQDGFNISYHISHYNLFYPDDELVVTIEAFK